MRRQNTNQTAANEQNQPQVGVNRRQLLGVGAIGLGVAAIPMLPGAASAGAPDAPVTGAVVTNIAGMAGDGEAVTIGSWAKQNGTHALNVTVTVDDAGVSIAKTYEITSSYGNIGKTWRNVTCTSSTGGYGGKDFELEAANYGFDGPAGFKDHCLGLRLKTVSGLAGKPATVTMTDRVGTKVTNGWPDGFTEHIETIKPGVTGEVVRVYGKTVDDGRYNIKDFGAKGDGASDDTRAVQACADIAKNSGGVVYGPPGTYVLNDRIILPATSDRQGVDLVGCGKHQTIFKLGSPRAGIEFKDGQHGSRSHGFQIDGAGVGETGLTLGLFAERAFSDILIRNTKKTGLVLNGTQNIEFNSVYIENSGGSGLKLDMGAGGNVFTRCEFVNSFINIELTQTAISAEGTYTHWGPGDNRWIGCIIELNNPDVNNSPTHFHAGAGDSNLLLGCHFAGSGQKSGVYGTSAIRIRNDALLRGDKTLAATSGPANLHIIGCSMSGGNTMDTKPGVFIDGAYSDPDGQKTPSPGLARGFTSVHITDTTIFGYGIAFYLAADVTVDMDTAKVTSPGTAWFKANGANTNSNYQIKVRDTVRTVNVNRAPANTDFYEGKLPPAGTLIYNAHPLKNKLYMVTGAGVQAIN